MTRFRALVLAGVVALTFNFVGCFDHGGGDPCDMAMAEGSGSTIIVC
jgi:hypothetical protein